MEAGRQRVRVLTARGADDEVLEASLGLVALGFEPLGEVVRLLAGGTFDAHLPRSEAAVELFLLPRLARGLGVPAVLLVDPVLDAARPRVDAVLAELGLDHRVRALGFGTGRGVDEDGVGVVGDREPVRLQFFRELARFRAEVAREAVEQAGRVFLFLDLDPDAPVVVPHVVRERSLPRVDWRERYDRAAARYAAGETRELDERQLVQLANAAWAAGLSLLMVGDRAGAREWLVRSAERYRESWQGDDAWGRPLGAMKALLIAGEDPSVAARSALDAGAVEADSPIGRYAGTLALLVLGRDEDAVVLASSLREGFPSGVAAALAALAARDAEAFNAAVAAIRRDFDSRESFLEDVPVPDTALALEALATSRTIRA